MMKAIEKILESVTSGGRGHTTSADDVLEVPRHQVRQFGDFERSEPILAPSKQDCDVSLGGKEKEEGAG